MSSSQSPTRKKAAAAAVPRRLRPTTARGPRYGVALSALFHALIFMAALFSFHRNFETPPDSNVVPVDLVTIADQTNIEAQSPPTPQAEPMERPQPSALEAPPEPEMIEAEPAPVPPMPQFEIAKEEPKPVEKPKPTRKAMQQQTAVPAVPGPLRATSASAHAARAVTSRRPARRCIASRVRALAAERQFSEHSPSAHPSVTGIGSARRKSTSLRC